MTRMLLFLALLCPAVLAAPAAPPPSLGDFARQARFQNIKISPGGQYLAAAMEKDDGTVGLVVLTRKEPRKVLSRLDFNGRDSLAHFYWANDERLVMTLTHADGSLDRPLETGEIYAMNADGSRRLMLFGERAPRQPLKAWAEIIDWLPKDPEQILVAAQPFKTGDLSYPTVYRLNIYSGRQIQVTRPPVKGTHLVADHQGNVRFAVGADLAHDNETLVAYRDKNGDEWQRLVSFNEAEGGFIPLRFMADDKRVLGLSDRGAQTRGLVIYDPATGKEQLLYRNPKVDAEPLFDFQGSLPGGVIGARVEDKLPQVVFFDGGGNSDYARDLDALMAAFPGSRVDITSATRDGQVLVVAVSGDRTPGDFYLFERKAKEVSFLLSARPWLEAGQLAKTRLIHYRARDGQEIQGYLTLPKGEDKALPLVLMAHGGPDEVRVGWGYNSMVQVLASRGYAVFQPNFRGSGGYGKAFQQAGYRHWGSLVIDDMTDGVRQLIKDGTVDGSRVCSLGGSFGGYAAVMSAEREPELYRCAIGYVGIYDLPLLFDNPGLFTGQGAENYRKKVLGEDEAALKAQSPIHLVDRLKGPVLIIAGGQDDIAPIDHAEELRDAMKAAGKPFEWYEEPTEGHGFYLPEHREKLFKKVLAFLDKNIGH
ncbi:S9 family peptidase [Gallaecimonas kandeliae]|uniref:alpha/beta hydrolase family protein n=1 Tax=Gallaecimonas kandeliae TaxID=3029055 RepID=UPI0026497857|nr:S9 family peptidase [Gallaecimonas kandeliae]WKE66312.1 S9 family peptidase [Gallaecimonas kandeliae]